MASQVATSDFAQGAPNTIPPLSQSNPHNQTSHFNENMAGSSPLGDSAEMRRTNSSMSQSHTLTPSRGGTLKKRQSVSRKNSMKRSGSKRGSRAGSVKSLTFADDVGAAEANNVFHTPVPTQGSPTEVLANRFQVWRKVLKDLITYFRDIQKSYDARSKSLYTLSNVISNITTPPDFVIEGGISDAISILQEYHKKAISEGNKAKSIEEDVIVQLTGLRSDLGQKIKEIKGLSGDFKNTVDKETEGTRRAVRDLQDTLAERNPDAKSDPFLVRLGVDRQVGRQIEEENYLHRVSVLQVLNRTALLMYQAFLNLESSGRELESIVMGEIQKAYNAYAGIIKREADEAYEVVENLRTGPLALPKDYEWNAFVDGNEHFVDPKIPVRKVDNITYPGKDDPAAAEVRAGMLERKSKYLKSYTPGWYVFALPPADALLLTPYRYVLSTTHLHEFKSPDRISSQTPVMSLALADQKLGSHSNQDSTSHKFMLKGRQSGGMHKTHAWVFRVESYDTMMAWFSDIKSLTETTGSARDAFIRRTHARSVSGGSHKTGSISDGSVLDEDEADQVPYSASTSQVEPSTEKLPQRPNPGGRFPSLLNVNRDSQVPLPPSSPSENSDDREIVAAAGALPGSGIPFGSSGQQVGDDANYAQMGEQGGASAAPLHWSADLPFQQKRYYSGLPKQYGEEFASEPVQAEGVCPDGPSFGERPMRERHDSTYGTWMAPAAAGTDGAAIEGHKHDQAQKAKQLEEQPGLQAVEMPAPQVLKEDMTASALAATQLSTFNVGDANKGAVAANGAASFKAQGLAHAADPGAPIKDLADRPPLESQTSGASVSQLPVPGRFPQTRTNTETL
ncbi:MAG: hypothetical protein Q9217_003891 [Psora testacea]